MIIQFNHASQWPIKLHGSHNFAMWKAQFSMLLHGHDIYGHLNGSTPSPSHTITTGTTPTANPAYSLFSTRPTHSKHTYASVYPTIATTIADANSAKTVWDALHTSYADKSPKQEFSVCMIDLCV